ncbi:MAG: DMT family transporter [Myxococcales bacterium]|nr:DMT family transporter [Myxococcales bacterium]
MGALAALGAALVWSAASLLFERHGKTVGGLALNLIKCVVAVVLMLPTLAAMQGSVELDSLTPHAIRMLAISGVIGLAIGDTFWFACMLRVGAQRALLLYTMSPPMAALLGHFVLGEHLSPWAAVGMLVTLAGVAWVILERNPEAAAGPRVDWLGVAFGFGSAACQAIGTAITKLGAPDGDALEVSIVRLAAGAVGLVVVMALSGRLRRVLPFFESRRTFFGILVASILGTYLGVWLMNAGFLLTEVGVAATLNATSPIFVLVLAWALLGTRPSLRSAVGAVVAVTGVGLLFWTTLPG